VIRLLPPTALPPAPANVGEYIDFVKVVGSLLAVGDRAGNLTLLDLSSPRRPASLSNTYLGREAYSIISGFNEDFPAEIRDVELRDTLLYIITVRYLIVLDISDPTNPSELARIQLPERLNDIEVLGDELWIAIADTYGDRVRLFVLDAADPLAIGVTAKTDLPQTDVGRVRLEGDVAYVTIRDAISAEDLQLFNLSDPRNPSLPYSVGALPAFRAWVRGRIAFVSTGRIFESSAVGAVTEVASVAIVDISDLENPRSLGYIWAPELAADLSVVDDSAFIIGVDVARALRGEYPQQLWFNVANLEDPAHLLVTRTVGLIGEAEGLAVSSGYAYVAAGESGLHVLLAEAAVLIDTLNEEDMRSQ
jgi:hypothetical protein